MGHGICHQHSALLNRRRFGVSLIAGFVPQHKYLSLYVHEYQLVAAVVETYPKRARCYRLFANREWAVIA